MLDHYIETVREADIHARTTGSPQVIVDRTGCLLVVAVTDLLATDRILETCRP